MDVLQNPHVERPEGESKLGEITRQFWLRAITVASESAQRRFIASFASYVYGVIDEASDREKGYVRGIADFLELRRLTAGAYASFFSVELGLDIPDKVMAHPAWLRTPQYSQTIYTRLTMNKLRDTVAITSSRSS